MSVDAVTAAVAPELIGLARHAAPYEACGLLEWDGTRMRVHELLNVAEEPRHSFLCDPREQHQALQHIFERETELWALWHSHPHTGPEPSDRDRAFAAAIGEDLRWVIVGLDPEGYWVGRP